MIYQFLRDVKFRIHIQKSQINNILHSAIAKETS